MNIVKGGNISRIKEATPPKSNDGLMSFVDCGQSYYGTAVNNAGSMKNFK